MGTGIDDGNKSGAPKRRIVSAAPMSLRTGEMAPTPGSARRLAVEGRRAKQAELLFGEAQAMPTASSSKPTATPTAAELSAPEKPAHPTFHQPPPTTMQATGRSIGPQSVRLAPPTSIPNDRSDLRVRADELLAQAQAGSTAARDALLTLLRSDMVAAARRILGQAFSHEWQDVVQNAAFLLAQRLDRVESGAVVGWARMTARAEAQKAMRAAKSIDLHETSGHAPALVHTDKMPGNFVDTFPSPDLSPDDRLDLRWAEARIAQQDAALMRKRATESPQEKLKREIAERTRPQAAQAYFDVALKGASLQSVADELGISTTTAQKRLAQAERALAPPLQRKVWKTD